MSERSQPVPTPEGEYFESNRFAGLSFLLGLIAFVALVLCLVGAIVNPHQFSYSWLFAFAFFFTLCVGCFFWTIVHHATDAEWSVAVRRQLENLAALLAVLALLFVPIRPGTSLRANSSPPSPSLLLDGYSTRSGGLA